MSFALHLGTQPVLSESYHDLRVGCECFEIPLEHLFRILCIYYKKVCKRLLLKSLNKNIICVERWNEGDGNVSNQVKNQSLLEFITGDDLNFYENYLVNLSEKEVDLFFHKNPDFMKSYHINKERRVLLRDKMYRDILKRIQKK